MFVVKYDKVSMIKLVQCVEKYPAIWNSKKLYSKEQLDESWDNVANELGEKDSLCRDRWHNIKSCYIRHLKYEAIHSRRKPYYLSEFLEFLRPIVSDRIEQYLVMKQCEYDNLPAYLREVLPNKKLTGHSFTASPRSSQEPQELVRVKSEVDNEQELSESEWLDVEGANEPSSSKTLAKRSPTSFNPVAAKKAKTLVIDSNNDEDVSFFKSLLPDISRMSNHQKLKFKQEALSIIEDILYATDEATTTS